MDDAALPRAPPRADRLRRLQSLCEDGCANPGLLCGARPQALPPTSAARPARPPQVTVAEAECSQPELAAAIAAIAPRVRHVHARVGHAEGPQVADPRGKWCARFTEGHMRWWRDIFAAADAAGLDVVTCTPEFGPAEYVPQSGDGEPVANVWEVNHWMGLHVQAACREQFGDGTLGRLVEDAAPPPEKV